MQRIAIIKNFFQGIRDNTPANSNTYSQVTLIDNTNPTALTSFQPVGSQGTGDGSRDDFYLMTIANLVRGNRSIDNDLVFQTKTTSAGAIRFQDGGGNLKVLIDAATSQVRAEGGLAIKDGVSGPSAVSGDAVIYVDSADGDLKIIFGDATVKTIVTDT
jgi:hypothetical protein